MEVHAVPVMGQGGHLPLPVLQEGHGPEGHEHAEEDCAWVVKQVAQLQCRQYIQLKYLCILMKNEYKQVRWQMFVTLAMVHVSDMFQALHVLQRGHIR